MDNTELTDEEYSRLDIDGKYILGIPNHHVSVKFVLNDNIDTIPDELFANSNITSITLPDSITTIGENAFANSDLKQIVLPDTITEIGNGAFNGISYLPSYVINYIKEINENAIDLEPEQEPTEYTVTFKNGDVVVKTVKGVTGTAVEAPANPEKEGFEFKGWSTDGETVILPIANIGEVDVTYIAVWEEIQQPTEYTITFKNGEETVKTVTGVTGTAVEAPANPEKEGFEFKGWSTDGETVILPIANIGEADVTYIAVWEEIQQELNYLYIGTTKPTSLDYEGVTTVSEYPADEQIYTNNSGAKAHIFVLTNSDKNVIFINPSLNTSVTQEDVDITTIPGYNIFETAVGTANTKSIKIRIL